MHGASLHRTRNLANEDVVSGPGIVNCYLVLDLDLDLDLDRVLQRAPKNGWHGQASLQRTARVCLAVGGEGPLTR